MCFFSKYCPQTDGGNLNQAVDCLTAVDSEGAKAAPEEECDDEPMIRTAGIKRRRKWRRLKHRDLHLGQKSSARSVICAMKVEDKLPETEATGAVIINESQVREAAGP